MTISYSDSFGQLTLRWRGSLYKAVSRDVIIFYVLYYTIVAVNYFYLDDPGKVYFTGLIRWFEIGTGYIPLSFLLGFFVAIVVARWWEQFNWISWPDKLMMTLNVFLNDDEDGTVKRTIARWTSLQAALAWRHISVRTLKRFPTERHLVDSGLMTEKEFDMYMKTEGPHGKWFMPLIWICNLLKRCNQRGMLDSVKLERVIKEVMAFRDGFAMLYVYDWVKIPLVYVQVVAIAVYGYFGMCLIARQPKLDAETRKKEVTILFPIFTTFQMIFYFGWMKVGQYLMEPFGEDDDDFELNYILDRNTQIAYMLANREVSNQLPEADEEYGLLENSNGVLPHTRASLKIQDVMPKDHLRNFKLTDDDMELIRTDQLGSHEAENHNDNPKPFRFRQLVRSRLMAARSPSNTPSSPERNHASTPLYTKRRRSKPFFLRTQTEGGIIVETSPQDELEEAAGSRRHTQPPKQQLKQLQKGSLPPPKYEDVREPNETDKMLINSA